MPKNKKRLKIVVKENIQPGRAEIVEDLTELNLLKDEHAEFFESLQEKQAKIISDLKAIAEMKEKSTTEL